MMWCSCVNAGFCRKKFMQIIYAAPSGSHPSNKHTNGFSIAVCIVSVIIPWTVCCMRTNTDFGSWFQKQIIADLPLEGQNRPSLLDSSGHMAWNEANQQDLNLLEKISSSGPDRRCFWCSGSHASVSREIFDQMRQSYDVKNIVIYQNLQISPDHGPSWLPIFGGSDVWNHALSLGHCDFCRDYLILFEYSFLCFVGQMWMVFLELSYPLDPLDPTYSTVQNWRPKHWATWVVFRTFNLTPWHL